MLPAMGAGSSTSGLPPAIEISDTQLAERRVRGRRCRFRELLV